MSMKSWTCFINHAACLSALHRTMWIKKMKRVQFLWWNGEASTPQNSSLFRGLWKRELNYCSDFGVVGWRFRGNRNRMAAIRTKNSAYASWNIEQKYENRSEATMKLWQLLSLIQMWNVWIRSHFSNLMHNNRARRVVTGKVEYVKRTELELRRDVGNNSGR